MIIKSLVQKLFLSMGLCLAMLFTSGVAKAQNDAVSAAKNYLTGRKILLSWRQGGAIYGTYYFVWIDHCNSIYGLVGNSERHTIMDNTERKSWREAGYWDVVQYQSQIAIRYRSTTGRESAIPVAFTNDGRIIARNGGTITLQGHANCR